MLRCMDPLIPASMHSLPHRYNIASRLWETAFRLLLERFRLALPQSNASASERSLNIRSAGSANVLDHLTDFVYYAYTFYTHLLEEQSLAIFGSAWIEQLGDVARYRMEIAGLAVQQTPSVPVSSARSRTSPFGQSAALPVAIIATDLISDKSLPRRQLQIRKGKGREQPARIDDDDLEEADTPGGNSIGMAALDDWDLEEREIWRAVARDWYNRGLMETPGTGRLHHHLAQLCKDDELKSLYHFARR